MVKISSQYVCSCCKVSREAQPATKQMCSLCGRKMIEIKKGVIRK